MQNKLNTHYYDGEFRKFQSLIKNVDQSFVDCLNEIKVESFNVDDESIKKNVLKVIDILLINRQANYDPINDIHMEDLLPYVWSQIKNFDQSGKNVFFEQFADILSGSCPQGRITRIWQFCFMINDSSS